MVLRKLPAPPRERLPAGTPSLPYMHGETITMDIWQEYLVAVALLVAGVYLTWRLRRVGRRDTPPACASCERCPSAMRSSCGADMAHVQDEPDEFPDSHSAS